MWLTEKEERLLNEQMGIAGEEDINTTEKILEIVDSLTEKQRINALYILALLRNAWSID